MARIEEVRIRCDFCGSEGDHHVKQWKGVEFYTHEAYKVVNCQDWCGECDPREAKRWQSE